MTDQTKKKHDEDETDVVTPIVTTGIATTILITPAEASTPSLDSGSYGGTDSGGGFSGGDSGGGGGGSDF